MNPITKFEWKDNIEQEKDLLEYISILEELYIPDFDPTQTALTIMVMKG